MNWRTIWFRFLLGVFLSWLGLEGASIGTDHGYVAFTLSDTIRDWQAAHPWLEYAVGAAFTGLWAHFFIQKNEKPK